MQKEYYEDILNIIKTYPDNKIKEALEDYHESDIADVLESLEKEDRLRVYRILGKERTAEIVTFYDDINDYIDEVSLDYVADILEEMHTDDAIDILNELDEDDKQEIIDRMENNFKETVKKIDQYEEDTLGREMGDNYIVINEKNTIQSATAQLIKQAGEHDNIFVIYVVDDDNKYVGAIDLRDLIVARKNDSFEDLIMRQYPYFYDDELVSETIGRIKDYAESSLPILNRSNQLVGVITSESILDVASEELEEDYAKLGGLTENEDISESTFSSVKKRIPWLVILLFLGFLVSSVIGAFEVVIATLPIIVFFQSMILDMSGNVGTQSLAVTIRNITDEGFKNDKKRKRKSIFKELKIGFVNGLIMGTIAFIFVLIYLVVLHKEVTPGAGYQIIEALKVSGIIGGSMFLSILLSSIIGTSFPLLLDKLHIDPAVASGPFITTINDVIAVVVYYGLTYLFFLLV